MPIIQANIHTIYWLRHKNHTDLMSEGYVGVSSNLKERLRQHFKNATNGYHSDKILSKAIVKYSKDEIVCDILIYGEKEYCYQTEKLIRPKSFIGWNTKEGGYHTPNWNPKGNKLPRHIVEKQQNILKTKRQNGEIVGNQRKVLVNGVVYNSIKAARENFGISISQMKRLLKQTPNYKTGNIKFANLKINYAD